MIAIGSTLISDDLVEKEFVCNLSACKGACCVAGAAGAPLDEKELPELEKNFNVIKKYLTPEGIKAIERKGLYVKTDDGYETPLIGYQGACAYVNFDENKIACCAIEKAYQNQEIDFQKPVSCHLYPIRIKEHKKYTAVNYEKWKICSPACKLGIQLSVPVYQFVKKALIRKFGTDWFNELEAAHKFLEARKTA